MRHDAGRIDLVLVMVIAGAFSLAGHLLLKSGGVWAGPAFLVIGLVWIIVDGNLESARRAKARARILDLIAGRGTMPPWEEATDLLFLANLGQEQHADCLKGAADRNHPARDLCAEAACSIKVEEKSREQEACRVLAAYVRERPDAPPSSFITGRIVLFGPVDLALDISRLALAGTADAPALEAAEGIVWRANSQYDEGRVQFVALAKEFRTRLEGLLKDGDHRKRLEQALK